MDILIRQLKSGMKVDLAGDRYADPDRSSATLEYELAEVVGMEWETAGCVRVDTTEGSYGFPPDHSVIVFPVDQPLTR